MRSEHSNSTVTSQSDWLSFSPLGIHTLYLYQFTSLPCQIAHNFHSLYLSAAGIIVEESCEIPDFEGPTIGIGKDTRTYLDTSTRSFGICCRVQGPSAYGLTWKRNKVAISGRDEGYNIRDGGYLTYTGTLMDGCAKYSCEVSFEAHDASREEITEICVGGMPTLPWCCGMESYLRCFFQILHPQLWSPSLVKLQLW